jgi:hypothetical protein
VKVLDFGLAKAMDPAAPGSSATLDLMGHQREGVAPDGRLLMVQNSDDFPIVVVQSWPMELARLVR